MVVEDQAAIAARALHRSAGICSPWLMPGILLLYASAPAGAVAASDTFFVQATVVAACAIPSGAMSRLDAEQKVHAVTCMPTPALSRILPPQPIVMVQHDDTMSITRLVIEF